MEVPSTASSGGSSWPKQGLTQCTFGRLDLADAYMRLWLNLEGTPSVALLIPKKSSEEEQLVGFKLYIPMGYTDGAPYFCIAIETIADTT